MATTRSFSDTDARSAWERRSEQPAGGERLRQVMSDRRYEWRPASRSRCRALGKYKYGSPGAPHYRFRDASLQ